MDGDNNRVYTHYFYFDFQDVRFASVKILNTDNNIKFILNKVFDQL